MFSPVSAPTSRLSPSCFDISTRALFPTHTEARQLMLARIGPITHKHMIEIFKDALISEQKRQAVVQGPVGRQLMEAMAKQWKMKKQPARQQPVEQQQPAKPMKQLSISKGKKRPHNNIFKGEGKGKEGKGDNPFTANKLIVFNSEPPSGSALNCTTTPTAIVNSDINQYTLLNFIAG